VDLHVQDIQPKIFKYGRIREQNKVRNVAYCRNKGHFGDFQKVSVSDVSFPS